MIVVLRRPEDEAELRKWVPPEAVFSHFHDNGQQVFILRGEGIPERLADQPWVERVLQLQGKYSLARKSYKAAGSVDLGPYRLGGERFMVIAGPCAVQGRKQLAGLCEVLAEVGVHALRGGAYKPRTSPYDFQGMGEEALLLMASARAQYGFPVVSEVMDPRQIDAMFPWVDCFQVGARNMQNFALLKALGQSGKTVMLKRGPAATVEEFLAAAEYLYSHGNPSIILCERGIRTFETSTRNTLDLNAVAVLKQETHLPVLVDPSHGTGRRDLVIPLSRAAAAVGADGIIVEADLYPELAASDGPQALTAPLLQTLMSELRVLLPALGRCL
ncbi:3-deoxy-7-phosphoheptulonate synthase [Pseudomonas sp. RIT-PI-AD]|uniref:3-deoxy-7-phosphoheptulonate synthase n=1 Tax=Pseudomonas sp. RIT-PI-AD TaxID=3035294 RepID=UPI0021D93E1D|nr:3-deoxy-7-phosphoheptulonate synthase [Pseudomonas sp. RIT-PI-AD]